MLQIVRTKSTWSFITLFMHWHKFYENTVKIYVYYRAMIIASFYKNFISPTITNIITFLTISIVLPYSIFRSLFTTHHLKRFHKISTTACYKIKINATDNQECHVINLAQLDRYHFWYLSMGHMWDEIKTSIRSDQNNWQYNFLICILNYHVFYILLELPYQSNNVYKKVQWVLQYLYWDHLSSFNTSYTFYGKCLFCDNCMQAFFYKLGPQVFYLIWLSIRLIAQLDNAYNDNSCLWAKIYIC